MRPPSSVVSRPVLSALAAAVILIGPARPGTTAPAQTPQGQRRIRLVDPAETEAILESLRQAEIRYRYRRAIIQRLRELAGPEGDPCRLEVLDDLARDVEYLHHRALEQARVQLSPAAFRAIDADLRVGRTSTDRLMDRLTRQAAIEQADHRPTTWQWDFQVDRPPSTFGQTTPSGGGGRDATDPTPTARPDGRVTPDRQPQAPATGPSRRQPETPRQEETPDAPGFEGQPARREPAKRTRHEDAPGFRGLPARREPAKRTRDEDAPGYRSLPGRRETRQKPRRAPGNVPGLADPPGRRQPRYRRAPGGGGTPAPPPGRRRPTRRRVAPGRG